MEKYKFEIILQLSLKHAASWRLMIDYLRRKENYNYVHHTYKYKLKLPEFRCGLNDEILTS